MPRKWFIAPIAASVVAFPAGAQPTDLPRFVINSQQELITALGISGFESGGPSPRAALVAREGARLVPWLVELARSDTLLIFRRIAAIEALGLTRHPVAVETLVEIAGDTVPPYRQALNALLGFPHPQVCRLWNELLTARDVWARYTAILGISQCGPNSRSQIDAIADTSRDETIMAAARKALSLFELPEDSRLYWPYHTTPPRADGVYVPSPRYRDRIEAALCTDRECPATIPPDFFDRGRER